MSELLIGSNNRGKLLEIQDLLKDLEIELLTPAMIGLDLEVEENGDTYSENAIKKGIAFAMASGYFTLADDSGLEVDALDGKPGIISARFSSKPHATDADRRTYLLDRLQAFDRPWTARFRCNIALVAPIGEFKLTEGVCNGEIIPQERGENGFGYDPIFYIPEMGRTMAELEMEDKNKLSHRARAVIAARPILMEYSSQLGRAKGSDLESRQRQIWQIHENTRIQIARDLHDGPTQTVAAIALRSHIARRLITQDLDAAQEELKKTEELARQTTKEMRGFLLRLRPLAFEALGLAAGLEALAEKMQHTFRQNVGIQVDEQLIDRLEPETQTAIYHIIEEAVYNAHKHAQAKRIHVRLTHSGKKGVILEVEDDGKGFDPGTNYPALENRKPLGIAIMRARVDLLDGKLLIHSVPKQGTRLQATFPLK